MGWGRTLILGDIGNRLDIEDTEQDISRVKRSLRGVQSNDMSQDKRIQALEKENGELKLYMATTIRLLLSKGLVTEQELEKMVEEIDGSDGSLDGTYDGSVI